jgi:hypothetical protein
MNVCISADGKVVLEDTLSGAAGVSVTAATGIADSTTSAGVPGGCDVAVSMLSISVVERAQAPNTSSKTHNALCPQTARYLLAIVLIIHLDYNDTVSAEASKRHNKSPKQCYRLGLESDERDIYRFVKAPIPA